jgi:hypothetical protein
MTDPETKAIMLRLAGDLIRSNELVRRALLLAAASAPEP